MRQVYLMPLLEEIITDFGGTAAAIVALAIWANHKFNRLCREVANLKGRHDLEE